MARKQEYEYLANSAFEHAAKEESSELAAQWELLGARYLELARQSETNDDNTTIYDPDAAGSNQE